MSCFGLESSARTVTLQQQSESAPTKERIDGSTNDDENRKSLHSKAIGNALLLPLAKLWVGE